MEIDERDVRRARQGNEGSLKKAQETKEQEQVYLSDVLMNALKSRKKARDSIIREEFLAI